MTALVLFGCAPPGEPSPDPTEPQALEIRLSPPPGVDWDSPPTVPPSPTPEPDPYAGLARVFQAQNADFFYVELSEEIKARITGMSYPKNDKNAPVGYGDLRYLRILYVNFEGETCKGELMVNAALADEVMDIFYQLYVNAYPLASVRLVDDFGEPGDDNLSMEANNTSCFNYRKVTGSSALSLHSYGAAIDINPIQNPYLSGSRVAPPAGADYVDRTLGLPGMIDEGDLCYRLFTSYDWKWGGDFKKDKDYQHFSKDIR